MTAFITLKNGFKLAYAEYGDSHGNPIFFFHGTPGSRYFRPPDEITARMGVKLICVDRPGYGESSFQPNRRVLDWPDDITQLADALRLDQFSIICHSGGEPYALACTYLLPGRVRAAAIISGAGSRETLDLSSAMSVTNKIGLKVGSFTPWPLWQILIWIFYHRRRDDPAAEMNRGNRQRPAADRDLLSHPGIREICIQSEIEAFRPGLRGLAWDARLLTRPWGFPLEQINTRVHLWHGSADNQVPIAMARYVAKKIPGSKLTIFKGEAHLLFFPHWEEILLQLLSE